MDATHGNGDVRLGVYGSDALAIQKLESEDPALAEKIDDDTYKAGVKIKVGPITVRYEGTAKVLERITPKMDILENQSYHRRLLMYKGVEKPAALLDTASPDPTQIATQGYGVANYYFVTGDTARARQVFDRILAGAGWNAFGYIAAEADVQRMR